MKYYIFGAGKRGKAAFRMLKMQGEKVEAFIDNSPKLWGQIITDGVRAISLEEYIGGDVEGRILISTARDYKNDIASQLERHGVTEYYFLEGEDLYESGRLISYCSPENIEDIILYYALEKEDNIFYIDVGSSDPYAGTVTKLLYDNRNAYGINIDPIPACIKAADMERPRDINICTGVGKTKGKKLLFRQEGGSTTQKEHVFIKNCVSMEIDIVPLKEICNEYIEDNRVISFLKIDVEGAEEDVLLGADFDKYRPKIIVMESTLPRTDIPSHENWEYILTDAKYHFVYKKGINRYYVADENSEEFDSIFENMNNRIENGYPIYYASCRL